MQIKSIAALSAVAGLMAVAAPAQAVIVVYGGPPIIAAGRCNP